jgi:hypothetical protein
MLYSHLGGGPAPEMSGLPLFYFKGEKIMSIRKLLYFVGGVGILLATIWGLRQIPVVGGWVDKALKN